MPILQSCYCCCSSAKQLAIAGGLFSLVMSSIYLTSIFYDMICASETNQNSMINGVLSVRLLNDETSSRQPSQTKVVAADDSQRFVGSIINPQGFSKDDLFYVNMIKISGDILVLMSIPVLFIGISQRRPSYLVPWIVANTFQSSTNLVETIYLLGLNTTRFEPTTAFIFTTNFFLLFAHVYAILGVISLCQEYNEAPEQDGIHFEMGPVHGQGQETKVKLVASNNGMNAKPKVTITYADHLDLEESVMNVSSTCKEIVTLNGGHAGELGGLNADSSSSPLQRSTPTVASQSPKSQNQKKYKNDAKHATKKSFSPMEAIEECSVENSQSGSYEISQPHQYPTSSSNKSSYYSYQEYDEDQSEPVLTSFLPSSNKTPIADHETIPLSGSTVSPTSNSTMVVMQKTNPLIDECPEATRPTSHKPILVHGNGGGARFQSFSTTAMATAKKYLLQSGFLETPSSSEDSRILEDDPKNSTTNAANIVPN